MLDLSGLWCPEVVLRAREHADSLVPGARLEIVSTDPLSRIDIPLWARKAGHELLEERADAGRFLFVLRLTTATATKDKIEAPR